MLVGVRSAFCSGLSQPKTLDRRNIALARAVIASRRRSNPGGRRTLLDCFAALAMTAPCLRQRSLENLLSQPRKNLFSSPRGGRWLTRRPLAIDICRLGAVVHPRRAFADAICPSGQRSGAVVDCSQRGPGDCRGSKNQRKGLPVLSNGLQSPRRLRAPLRHRGGRHLMIITPLRLDTRRPRSGPSRRMGAPSCFETLSPG